MISYLDRVGVKPFHDSLDLLAVFEYEHHGCLCLHLLLEVQRLSVACGARGCSAACAWMAFMGGKRCSPSEPSGRGERFGKMFGQLGAHQLARAIGLLHRMRLMIRLSMGLRTSGNGQIDQLGRLCHKNQFCSGAFRPNTRKGVIFPECSEKFPKLKSLGIYEHPSGDAAEMGEESAVKSKDLVT